MRCIIGREHRECIERRLFPGCRVLEWGSGGSTLWLADRLPEGAHLTSVEHHGEWYASVRQKIGSRDNVTMIHAEPQGDIGVNATADEEDPTALTRYLDAPGGQKYDVIIVDGVARGTCMERARDLLNPGGVVFLHDAQRDWYDKAKGLFIEHGTIGSCEDYPSPLLWWGGLEPERARGSAAAAPVVISFYTLGTPYEEEVEGLKKSCWKLGLDHVIQGVEPKGSWERNCAMKARYILEESRRLDRPVLWVDADAVVRQPPVLLAGGEMDFAVQKAMGWQFNSATVFFNRTPIAQKMLERWTQMCEERPEIWDQIHLDAAWESVVARHPLRTCWLPQTYAKIYDMDAESRLGGLTPVIEQFQASRRFKDEVSETVRTMRDPGEDLQSARKACRPRRCWYDERFVVRAEDPGVPGWAAEVAA